MVKKYKMKAYNALEGLNSPCPCIYKHDIKNEFNHFTVGDLIDGYFEVWLNVNDEQNNRILSIDGVLEG